MVSKGTARHRARLAGWLKAAAMVPLALLTGSLTSAVGSPSEDPTAASAQPVVGSDAPIVPTAPFEVPASVQLHDPSPTGVDPHAGPDGTVSTISSNGIPTAALLAYQRAATVLDQADPACNLDWPLIAALGRVESDHGRANGNVLDAFGLSTPGIYGVPLTGQGGTARITDSDNGVYDHDAVWDRAVGPMQFIPTTWEVVAVDGDNDGAKNPQDLDDAALATAVYLCAGEGDLSTDPGARAAVYRYNHSADYVNLVMSIAEAYAMGDYTMVPNGTTSPTVLTDLNHDAAQDDPKGANVGAQDGPSVNLPPDDDTGGGNDAGDDSGNTGDDHSDNNNDGDDDTGGNNDGDNNGGGGNNDGDNNGGGGNTGGDNNGGGGNTGGDGDESGDVTDTAENTVKVLDTLAEGTQWCQRQLANEDGITQRDIRTCAHEVVGQTLAQATATLDGLLDSLVGDLVCGLLGCQRDG